MPKNDSKLCYVLPLYDLDTDTHYFHLYEFIEEIGRKCSVYLVVEKAKSDVQIKNIEGCYIQRFRWFPLRIAELIFVVFKVRLLGYRKYYIHYSILPALIIAIIAKATRAKTYLWCCVMAKTHYAKWEMNFNSIKRKLFIDIPMDISFSMVDYLVTCNCFMKEYLRINYKKNNVIVIPNWVNLKRFNIENSKDKEKYKKSLNILEDKKIVLYLHSIDVNRGSHLITTIAQKVIEKYKNVLFIIAGSGPYENKLKKDIADTNFHDIIKYIGKIPNKDVVSLFCVADIFINPTVQEAFGRVLLESMAMGVPFVSTDGGGGVLSFTSKKQQKYIAKPEDIEEFSEKILELLNNKEKRDVLKKEGLELVRNYNIENIAEKYIELVIMDN
ncbi:MAG: hypothetical protein A2252_07445 [Elusimicrobia bacterium RIFOXYA2_FULL_39_19]|nr:MAG: hypothetical protein A2252_07445 [Elusimicrobia bacterium RIFOXYA2_FULL_39_19]